MLTGLILGLAVSQINNRQHVIKILVGNVICFGNTATFLKHVTYGIVKLYY